MTKEERLQKELVRLKAMYQEQSLISGDARFVFGIDEAGRGPLCGPVATACCILPENPDILYLNDSKKLSEKKRELLFDEIREKALAYGIAMVSEQRIDEINILNATLEGMKEAFELCMKMYRERFTAEISSDTARLNMDAFDDLPGMSDTVVLIDGNRAVPGIMYPQTTVVSGDARCPSISAASILAKVTRDRLLLEYDEKYPEYGFARNKGYGTKEHVEAIKKYGILPIHRKTFLKNIL